MLSFEGWAEDRQKHWVDGMFQDAMDPAPRATLIKNRTGRVELETHIGEVYMLSLIHI